MGYFCFEGKRTQIFYGYASGRYYKSMKNKSRGRPKTEKADILLKCLLILKVAIELILLRSDC